MPDSNANDHAASEPPPSPQTEDVAPAFDQTPLAWPPRDAAIREALLAAYESGDWGRYHGENLDALTARCASQFSRGHALPCSSGTVAVELALRGLRVQSGDEVILAAYDFSGNFHCIHAVGGRPVLVDLAPDRWTLDIARVEQAINDRTKAIIASHLHGDLAPMRELRDLARKMGIGLVEDACQSAGAVVDGRPVGSWGDVSTLSFGGSKLLSAGRGGMVLTDDAQIRQRIVIASQQGNNAYPLSELQAAVLLPQLEMLEQRNETRRERLQMVRETIRRVPLASRPVFDDDSNKSASFRWGFFLTTDACSREQAIAALQSHRLPIDAGFRGFTKRTRGRCERVGPLRHAERAIERTLLLHHGMLLCEPPIVRRAADAINEVLQRLPR